MSTANPDRDSAFWQRKLAAFLHDPPSKCLNLGEHEEWSAQAMSAAGLAGEKYPRIPDWEASAADRMPFPRSRAAAVSCRFDGVRAGFHHPLGAGSGSSELRFDRELSGFDALEGKDSRVQPVLDESALVQWSETERARARFFAHWRLWRQWAQEKDWRYGFLPADTRIPDHTIWHHMQVTSALAGCAESWEPQAALRPAFLRMQLGPVQEFIAAARSTRDLWSGSYLLSWLMAAGLRHLAEAVGPDAVVFPSLWGQPLFDLHCRSLWQQLSLSSRPRATRCWEAIEPKPEAALTPNLPNVFLALVPASGASALAASTTKAIREELKRIAESVWAWCDARQLFETDAVLTKERRKQRFDRQIEAFLNISWQITPWPDDLPAALALASGHAAEMPVQQARRRIEAIREMAERLMPTKDRDPRYFENSGPPSYRVEEASKLKSRGLAWSVLVAQNAWEADATRQVRSFAGRLGAWEVGVENNKDVLDGCDEAVAGGKEWEDRVRKAEQADKDRLPKGLVRDDAWLGALTLVKRFWHLSYLHGEWGLPTDGEHFPMPNTHGVAAHEPFSDDQREEPNDGEKYFAVLAFDGDEIGKWVSGAKTPKVRTQLADYADGGILEYFERPEFEDRFRPFLEAQRTVSPSYHLQFSEALGNFALRCAASVVEAHDGRLIYSGGDDILALLPADSALSCAQDLVRAFQGNAPVASVEPRLRRRDDSPPVSGWLTQRTPGFLCSRGLRESTGKAVPDEEKLIPFVVPGPRATASVGIAIAHFKSPLQDAVRAAQAAERRAKNELGRNAVAVSLFKRSGEITEWGCRWDSGGLELYTEISTLLADQVSGLSGRFAHRVCQLLEPYLNGTAGRSPEPARADVFDAEEASEVILREFGFAAVQQGGREVSERLTPQLRDYLASVRRAESESQSGPQALLRAVVGLCSTVAFADRNRSEPKSPKGRPTAR